MNYQRDFTIGVKETQDFSRTLVLEARWKSVVVFGLLGALGCWAYLMWLGLGLGPVLVLAMMAGTALVTAGAMTASMLLANRSKARRQFYAEHRDSYLQQVDISGLGIRVTVGKDRARLSFDKLMKVRETRRAFYLFLSANQAWILPKAQMEDPAGESRQLRAIFSTFLDARRLRLRRD